MLMVRSAVCWLFTRTRTEMPSIDRRVEQTCVSVTIIRAARSRLITRPAENAQNGSAAKSGQQYGFLSRYL